MDRLRKWPLVAPLIVVVGLSVGAGGTTGAVSRRAMCKEPSALGRDTQIPTKRGTLWSLASGGVPVAAGARLKVVWRITGQGKPNFVFKSPEGEKVALTAGPTAHSWSTWQRPGKEYGTVFTFSKPGCWTIRVERGATKATVYVKALPVTS